MIRDNSWPNGAAALLLTDLSLVVMKCWSYVALSCNWGYMILIVCVHLVTPGLLRSCLAPHHINSSISCTYSGCTMVNGRSVIAILSLKDVYKCQQNFQLDT